MSGRAPLRVSRQQVVAYRLEVNHLLTRLPAGSHTEATRYALQDSYPRSALLSMHARMHGCRPNSWALESLVQTYSPRAAVHLFPRADLGVFTVGRLPGELAARRRIDAAADLVCAALAGRQLRATDLPESIRSQLRAAAPSGRLAVRWSGSSLHVREIAAPSLGREQARLQLARRHLRSAGPSTPAAFAWWAGLPTTDAHRTWQRLAGELVDIDLDGVAAWLLAADLPDLRVAADRGTPSGIRLLPAEERQLFGRDPTHRFAGPSPTDELAPADRFHPHLLVIDGSIVGRWGRRAHRVEVIGHRTLTVREREVIEREAVSMPLAARARVEIVSG